LIGNGPRAAGSRKSLRTARIALFLHQSDRRYRRDHSSTEGSIRWRMQSPSQVNSIAATKRPGSMGIYGAPIWVGASFRRDVRSAGMKRERGDWNFRGWPPATVTRGAVRPIATEALRPSGRGGRKRRPGSQEDLPSHRRPVSAGVVAGAYGSSVAANTGVVVASHSFACIWRGNH